MVVVGNGNVAIDCARVLCKTREELAPSDMSNHIVDVIQAAPIKNVYMVGRRGPIEAKFTNVELREMGKLENCMPIVRPEQLPDEVTGDWSDRDQRLKERNLATLREFLEVGDKTKVTLRFRGREMAHQDLGANLLARVREDLEEYGVVEQMPQMEGRQMIMVIAPKQK